MIADEDVEGIDPYDEFDAEAARVDAYLSSLPDDSPVWSQSSRCDGWTVRDVVAHLAATEEYHHACLDDTLGALLERGIAAGVSDVAGFNAIGISEREDRAPSELVAEWRSTSSETRRRFRERDGGELATMVGAYPVRSQAFHIASELAIHADDLGLPVDPGEVAERSAWRAAFSRGALREEKPDVEFEVVDGGTRVRAVGVEQILDDATLVDAFAGRLGDESPLPRELRAALSAMP